jgi:hypothetical protein
LRRHIKLNGPGVPVAHRRFVPGYPNLRLIHHNGSGKTGIPDSPAANHYYSFLRVLKKDIGGTTQTRDKTLGKQASVGCSKRPVGAIAAGVADAPGGSLSA